MCRLFTNNGSGLTAHSKTYWLYWLYDEGLTIPSVEAVDESCNMRGIGSGGGGGGGASRLMPCTDEELFIYNDSFHIVMGPVWSSTTWATANGLLGSRPVIRNALCPGVSIPHKVQHRLSFAMLSQ